MELALNVESIDDVAARLTDWLDFKSPQGLLEKVKMLPRVAELGKFFPREVKSGRCQEVVKREGDFSLHELPILKCWEADGGRYITFPLVFTRNPRTGKRNCGIYRMQIYDEKTTGMQQTTSMAQHIIGMRSVPAAAAWRSPWRSELSL
jgi:4-hydroxy-3-polyprenylbenzoate decarboxylase